MYLPKYQVHFSEIKSFDFFLHLNAHKIQKEPFSDCRRRVLTGPSNKITYQHTFYSVTNYFVISIFQTIVFAGITVSMKIEDL